LPSSEGEDLSRHVERRKPVSLSGASLCRQVGPDHATHFQKLLYPACNTTLGRHGKNDAGHQLKAKIQLYNCITIIVYEYTENKAQSQKKFRIALKKLERSIRYLFIVKTKNFID
jgi:hypothetical protein